MTERTAHGPLRAAPRRARPRLHRAGGTTDRSPRDGPRGDERPGRPVGAARASPAAGASIAACFRCSSRPVSSSPSWRSALAGGLDAPASRHPSRIVFVRDGDLFVSAIDGTGATLIREGGADGTAARLPGGPLVARHAPIAAVRDLGGPVFLTPASTSSRPTGRVRRSIEPGPGGTPSLSWSPDSRRLAIVTYQADVQRDATELDAGEIRLAIVGIDGGSRDVVVPLADGSPMPSPRSGRCRTCRSGGRPTAGGSPWRGKRLSVRRWHLVAADGSAVRR